MSLRDSVNHIPYWFESRALFDDVNSQASFCQWFHSIVCPCCMSSSWCILQLFTFSFSLLLSTYLFIHVQASTTSPLITLLPLVLVFFYRTLALHLLNQDIAGHVWRVRFLGPRQRPRHRAGTHHRCQHSNLSWGRPLRIQQTRDCQASYSTQS